MMKDKIIYIVALIAEFAKRYGITDAEAAKAIPSAADRLACR
jgi:hypothetical protein